MERQLSPNWSIYNYRMDGKNTIPSGRHQSALVNKEEAFLKKFHQLIEQHFQNCSYSVDDMASDMHMSKRSLQKKLKSMIDQSPKEYLVLYRLNYAAQLLCKTTLSIGMIQELSGFSNASGFAHRFKRYHGISARIYRNQNNSII